MLHAQRHCRSQQAPTRGRPPSSTTTNTTPYRSQPSPCATPSRLDHPLSLSLSLLHRLVPTSSAPAIVVSNVATQVPRGTSSRARRNERQKTALSQVNPRRPCFSTSPLAQVMMCSSNNTRKERRSPTATTGTRKKRVPRAPAAPIAARISDDLAHSPRRQRLLLRLRTAAVVVVVQWQWWYNSSRRDARP